MMSIPTHTLNDGLVLPAIGLGTYKLTGPEGVTSIRNGIDAGYRLLDTATRYENEAEVGQAIAESGIRDELIVTTKLPGAAHGFDETMMAFERSREVLGLDVIDLYLIHWPNPSANRFVDSWHAMVELQQDGLVRSIGVCNFTPEFLARIIDATGVTPSVNQVELHPYFPQAELRAVHTEFGIQTESWSPLARGSELLTEPVIREIAVAHGKTEGQVVLRWHTQLGSIPIPKATSPERQRENFDIFGFELSADEIAAISSLERGRLWGGDPNVHEEY